MTEASGRSISSKSFDWLPFRIFLAGFAVLLILGLIGLHSADAMPVGNQLSFERSLLLAVNALTLTGFQTVVNPSAMLPLGRFILFGLMLGGIVLILTANALAIRTIVGLRWSNLTLIAGVLVISALAVMVGTFGLMRPGCALLEAAFDALAAYGNCGLHWGPVPPGDDWRIHGLILPLAIVGSLGIPVILDLLRCRLSEYSRIVLVVSAGGYLFCLLTLWTGTSMTLTQSSVLATNTRTLGSSLSSIRELSPAGQWLLIPMMMLGGTTGGLAGGIKLTTLAVLLIGIGQLISGQRARRGLAVAIVWVIVYLLMVFGTIVLLLTTQPQLPGQQMPFLAVSAISNVGLSADPITISGGGVYVLSGAMLLGRIIPMLILWWQASVIQEADLPVG